MTRTVHVILACGLMFGLLLSALPASASPPSPCADRGESTSTANCARFRTYLQQLVDRWSDHPSAAIPESTMAAPSQGYAHNWDDNDVAYVPESTMAAPSRGYVHNWDDNDVAYIPESTMATPSRGYAHNWDDNDVAYIPESTIRARPRGYVHSWDDNDVAYIPESTMTIPLEKLFGAEFAQVDGE